MNVTAQRPTECGPSSAANAPQRIADGQRVTVLRERCLSRRRKECPRHGYVTLTAQGFREAGPDASLAMRRAMATRARLGGVRLEFDEMELLAGRPAVVEAQFTPEQEEAAKQYVRQWPGTPGQTGHCELDVSGLFRVGIRGLAEDIRRRMTSGPSERAETYRTFLLALEGLQALIRNAAQTVRASSANAPAWRRAEVDEIVASCLRIAEGPPETFRDAIQLLWFADMGVMLGDIVGLVGPGHMDRTLRPFYEADVRAGRITREQALVLIESLYLLLNEFLPNGLAIPVMVGGRDSDGNDLTNDLSHLCLEALRRTALTYPTVGVCWHEGTPQSLMDLAVELVGHGYMTPAFFGDETIQRGMKRFGVPAAQACDYINSTCVEITPVGASNVWVASPYLPVCNFLLAEIAEQAAGKPAASFDEFLSRYKERLSREIASAAAAQNVWRKARFDHGGKPLQSVLTRDCIARGLDIDRGGALYNWVECSFVGMANLADSLHVIREEVYRTGRYSLPGLKALLDSDYADAETVRQRFLHALPKYGNGVAAVDALVAEMSAFVTAECAKHRMAPDGSPFVPGMFCWIKHMRLGLECGATPDGRKAGLPFADGAGPAQGREKRGPTAAILSTTSWDHSVMIGGLAYNMKFSKGLFASPRQFDRLRDLITTFLRRGGFETQINVVDHATLVKARAHPEQYEDLVVRIGGYTDYFVKLHPKMQEEVMMRSEFGE